MGLCGVAEALEKLGSLLGGAYASMEETWMQEYP